MKPACERLWQEHYSAEEHAFNLFEKRIASALSPDFTVLDAGCGEDAPVLAKFSGRCRKAIGVDLVDFDPSLERRGMHLMQNDLSRLELPASCVDLVISRSVLEHVPDVEEVYRELNRVLKPGGKFIFLVPNFWDYVSILSYLIPNCCHKFIVERTSGRAASDTFATYYKSNTSRSIRRLAERSGFTVSSLEYLGQYPDMLAFSSLLFRLGICYDKLMCRYPFLASLRGWILCELRKVPSLQEECQRYALGGTDQ